MGSTSYITKPKAGAYRAKSGSSAGSDKEMNGKLKRNKIRRPTKMNDYGLKRVPDYTELAYKEAVSKLRYFLSGNYAPSVRSYGGSASIKNLDESDGDLDKKYAPSYTALTEYKPRPRLTAKYTTLYADSLKNYAPEPVNNVSTPAPSAPVGDVTGGTSPDVINFIQKQEEYIEQLERESQYCRDELNNLLGKVKEVISENEHLHEAQKNKLITRMFNSYQGSETDELDDAADSTGVDSDHKVSPSKPRRSAKSRTTKLEGPNIVFESRIAELEAQLTQAKIDLKKVQDENNDNKRKLASGLVDSTCLDGFKRQIDNLQRDKSSLEAQISKLKLSLEQQDSDGGRYKRSDALEQQLREERNNLEAEVRRLKDDLSKERNKVRELAGEGARRAIQERSAAEQRYHAHCDQLQHDLAAQYDNAAKLQLDLERQRREENDLKRELSMKNSAIEELKMELKNKTASLQADLAQAHAEKASLEEELASARLAIERQQRQSKHETNRLNSEIQSLRQRLDRADADLVHSRRENLRLTEQIANLEKELNMKNLTPVSPEKNKKEKELSSMLESMENKHAKTVAELEAMIQSQNSLMEKLTGECRLLTDKLDDANRRHKEELATLQRQVNTLGRSLHQPQVTPSTYQAPTTHPSATNRNVLSVPSDPGRDHPGDISTGHPPLPEHPPLAGHLPLAGHTDRPDRVGEIGLQRDDRQIQRALSKEDPATQIHEQNSPTTVLESEPFTTNKVEDINTNQYVKETEPVHESKEPESDYHAEPEEPIKVEQEQFNTENYEQNYEQNPEYQNQYEQNYEQPAYSEEQVAYKEEHPEFTQEQTEYAQEHPDYTQEQYENYEQYPQQYTDPNAHYDEQYDYQTDANYQGDPNYVNPEFAQNETYQEIQNQDYQNAVEDKQLDESKLEEQSPKQPSQS